jgi:uncharacterized membrane protein YfhO
MTNDQQPEKTVPHSFHDWAMAIWFSLSGLFLLYSIFKAGDELISRRELAISIFVSIVALSFVLIITSRLKHTRFWRGFALTAALILGMILSAIFAASVFPDFLIIRNLDVRILERNDQAETSLVWAYWAEHSRSEEKIPQAFKDISFSNFEVSGSWSQVEGQPLKSVQTGDSLHFQLRGIHFHQPVITMLSEGGEALVEVNFNGRRSFYRLNGLDSDPLIIDEMAPSAVDLLGFLFLYTIAFSGLLYWLLLILLSLIPQAPAHSHASDELPDQADHSVDRPFLVLLLSFFIPIAILLGILLLLHVTPFGDRTFLRIDMGRQYAAFLGSLKWIVSGENDLFYTFGKGLGGSMVSLAAYYLANPINWLAALFPTEMIPFAITLLVLIRCGLCGLTSAVYFRAIGLKGWNSLIFSTAYALMSYTMVNAENYFFIDGMIFLPLVSLGVEKLVKRQTGWIFLFSLTAIFFIQFYMAYMVALFSLLLLCYLLIMQQDFSARERIKIFLQWLGWSILALGLAAVVLVPVANQLAVGPSRNTLPEFLLETNFPLQNLLTRNLALAYQPIDIETGLPLVYSGSVITFLVTLFLFNRKISILEKVTSIGILGIFLVSFYLRPLDLIWHGFSKPNWWSHRYAFIFTFWMIRIAARSWLRWRGIDRNAILVVGVITLSFILIAILISVNPLSTLAIFLEVSAVFVCLGLFFYFLRPMGKGRSHFWQALFLLNTTILAINAFFILRINLQGAYSAVGWKDQSKKTVSLLMHLEDQDDSFYRIEDLTHLNENEPLLFSYAGLSHYSSTVNWQTVHYLASLGVSQYHFFTRYDPGVPMATDSLTGIRYLIALPCKQKKPYQIIYSEGGKSIYQNELALPLAFNAVNVGSRLDFSVTENIFERLNRIFATLTGDERQQIYTPVPFGKSQSDDGETELWQVEPQQAGYLYAWFEAPSDYPTSAIINNSDFSERFNESRFGVALFGEVSPSDQISFTFNTPPDFNGRRQPAIYSESLEVLRDAVSTLTRFPIELYRDASSRISGSWKSAPAGSYIVLSFPYEAGWQLRVDGTETELLTAVGGLMAFQVPDTAAHQFELVYIPPGLRLGTWISAASLILALILFAFQRWQARRTITGRAGITNAMES